MTNRAQEIEGSLTVLATVLGQHQDQVAGAATSAEGRALSCWEHGWDGVALGYEATAQQLTEIASALQEVGDRAVSCVGILHPLHSEPGLGDVSERLNQAADEIDTRLDGVLTQLEEARSALATIGEEYLTGVLHGVVEGIQESAEALSAIQKDIAQEQASALPGETEPGPQGGDPPGARAEVQARIEELRRQGHTPQRHGAQVTDQQLTDRALWGKDPMTGTTTDGDTGGTHKYGRDATKFTSDRALVESEKYMRSAPDFTTQKHSNKLTGDVRIRLEIPLREIFGSNYRHQVHGIRRPGSKSKPTGDPPGSLLPSNTDFTDGTMFAFFRMADDGEYKLRTMYPRPKDET